MAKVTEKVLSDAFKALAAGETLSGFCKAKGRPSRQAVIMAIERGGAEAAERFRLARDAGFEVMAEKIIEIVDEDPGVDDKGKTDTGAVRHQQIRADYRLRLLSKWCTARYGERLEVAGDANAPLGGMSKDEMRDEIMAILAGAMKRKIDAAPVATNGRINGNGVT